MRAVGGLGAVGGAGCVAVGDIFAKGVIDHGDLHRLGLLTARAGAGLFAHLGAARLSRDLPLAKAMLVHAVVRTATKNGGQYIAGRERNQR